jgi:OOP family OmpA-OmpF porin
MVSSGARLVCLALLVGVSSVSAPSAAFAQDAEPIPQGEFNVMRFSPAPGAGNYFQVEGASTPGHIQGSAGLTLDYAHLPFVLWNASCDPGGVNCDVDDTRAELVQYVAAGHLTGSFSVLDHLQIGLVAPLVITGGEAFEHAGSDGSMIDQPGGTAFALADPRLSVKGRFYTDAPSGISIGASAFITFPTGRYAITSGNRYVGDAMPSFGGVLIAEMITSGLHLAANVGGMWREEVDLFSTHVGPQLLYSGAIAYDITPLVSVLGEFVGASTFSDQVDEHFLEWRAGGRLRIDDFEVSLAIGTGIGTYAGSRFVMGTGTPLVRVLGGFQWAPMRADRDGDGIDDGDDRCPAEAEDDDDYEPEDGCPEDDNDGDGRLDADDPCPDEAEDMDGHEDEDGCPDTDNDGDGVPDGYDSCINEPEDRDGDRDEDGCPEADEDRDGIPDETDQCRTEAEDFDGWGDEDGCPEEDFDGDSRPDGEDQCPDQPEDMDGFEDEDGCPEEGSAPAQGPQPRPRRGR